MRQAAMHAHAGISVLQDFTRGVSRKAARHYRSKPFTLRNQGPIVSFTFDDVPDTAYLNGARLLDEFGWRGTFYIAAGTCGLKDECWRVLSREQVADLHARGHEIGCHTFSHVNVQTLDAAALEREIARNKAALAEISPDIVTSNFAFPFGKTSFSRKQELKDDFDTLRGIYQGVNAGTIDLAMLRVIELYDETLTPEKLEAVLRETRERNGWLIFYTHDVAERPSAIGCSPRLMAETLEAVREAGFACLTIRDALKAVGYGAR